MTTTYKACRKCGAEKPLASFSADLKNPDGLNTQCRDCRSVAYKVWRKRKNKDSIWPRNNCEVVIDQALMAWRYPVSSAQLAWRA